VISLADRVVKIAGITTRPDESWMLQMARNETDSRVGALGAKRYLILDRDTKYYAAFRQMLCARGFSGDPLATALAQSECVCGTMGPKRP